MNAVESSAYGRRSLAYFEGGLMESLKRLDVNYTDTGNVRMSDRESATVLVLTEQQARWLQEDLAILLAD